MVKIVIENLDKKELEVNNDTQTVLNYLQVNFVDWMHACGGKGRCTTCKMEVISGAENLTKPTAAELKYQQAGELEGNERLTCQARVVGDIVIRVPESGKMPHLNYTD